MSAVCHLLVDFKLAFLEFIKQEHDENFDIFC